MLSHTRAARLVKVRVGLPSARLLGHLIQISPHFEAILCIGRFRVWKEAPESEMISNDHKTGSGDFSGLDPKQFVARRLAALNLERDSDHPSGVGDGRYWL